MTGKGRRRDQDDEDEEEKRTMKRKTRGGGRGRSAVPKSTDTAGIAAITPDAPQPLSQSRYAFQHAASELHVSSSADYTLRSVFQTTSNGPSNDNYLTDTDPAPWNGALKMMIREIDSDLTGSVSTLRAVRDLRSVNTHMLCEMEV